MSKFSTENNILYTNALFKELDYQDAGVYIYTIGHEDIEEDGRVLPSIRKAYLELEDLTEYEVATKYFQSWAHWKKVRESSKVKPYIDEWREELEVRMKSRGLKGIMGKASSKR